MRDSLDSNVQQPYEWLGDHLFTNFVQLHQRLTETAGYYVEILTDPFTCFDAENYGALMIIDPEDYFSEEEIAKLQEDIEHRSLSLIVLADWYNEGLLKQSAIASKG